MPLPSIVDNLTSRQASKSEKKRRMAEAFTVWEEDLKRKVMEFNDKESEDRSSPETPGNEQRHSREQTATDPIEELAELQETTTRDTGETDTIRRHSTQTETAGGPGTSEDRPNQ